MKIDFERFKGTLPYASERFGIYQPLLGWKSRLTRDRFDQNQDVVLRGFSERALRRSLSNVVVTSLPDGVAVTNLKVQEIVGTRYVPRIATEIDSAIVRTIVAKLPADRRPTPSEWQAELARTRLDEALQGVKDVVVGFVYRDVFEPGVSPDVASYVKDARARERKLGRTDAAEAIKPLLDREVSVATYLSWLAARKPELLDDLFYRRVSDPFEDLLTFRQDPLATIGDNGLDAVLSPIGIVHQFNEFFYEFDTFLGSPVGHVWLSPGSTLELVEEVVRRSLTEKLVETLMDSTERTEKNLAVHDELSTAIKEENRSDLRFGFGANVQYDNGTLEAGAHTDLSIQNARMTAREVAHKQMREQSEKLSSEIRRSFRSVFRTVVETTSTNSRRYVLQNSTNTLVNYELRRKMRQVGVQVQDIGAQLCWQVFVDDPGRELGVAKLVHIAPPPDLAALHAPPQPVFLEAKSVTVNLQFPFMIDTSAEGGGETGALYIEGDDQEWQGGGIEHYGKNDRIFHKKTFELTPPAPGYTLTEQLSLVSHHSGPVVAEPKRVGATNSVEITLHQVNFNDQPAIEFQLTSVWKPDEMQNKALADAYKEQLKTYEADKTALERLSFLSAARERIKLASQVRSRSFEDLREEERILVYRSLIGQLMAVGDHLQQDQHLTSELIRAIFDVDRMLYFVAPEWWRPRAHPQGHRLTAAPAPEVVTEKDVVGWEGPLAAHRRSNYLITEESDPAPLGSSLGWLLQLDGDPLRNAFLNSPWVKAIIPIRPGKAKAAINWLRLANVAGSDGLDAAYHAPAEELRKIRDTLSKMGRTPSNPVTLHDALMALSECIEREYREATTAKPSPFDPNKHVIPTETVFEHGFDPLKGGFEVNTDPTRVFSEWVQVVATDQVVAVPYDAEKHL